MRSPCLHPALALCSLLLFAQGASAQLFDNLRINSTRVPLGDPSIESSVSPEGPKGVVTADFDRDGFADVAASNADGTVNVLYGAGDGGFAERLLLTGEAATLRGIIAADLNGDAAPDIAGADPFSGQLLIFLNSGTARGFETASNLPTWHGARNLLADDFDGDGRVDLVVAGSPTGLKHFRGDGGGGFTEAGMLAGLGTATAQSLYEFKPVYTLRSFTPAGSALPKLAVTHAHTTSLWILGSAPTGDLQIEAELFSSPDDPNFRQLHDFEIAPLSSPLTSSTPDLVTVSKVTNTVTVWRCLSDAPYFSQEPFQQFSIAGGPRAVSVADTNHDGWGELAIVVRNFDRALVFRNAFGLLEPMATLPSPRSPRELVMPDLNGDGCADVIVINRKSNDLQ
ncbi:MAG: FG-GAP repeat domain-containing protein, partial [Verrucomicrobiales bacterium]